MTAADTTNSPTHWVERPAAVATADAPVDVTGAKGGNAALTALLVALESLGLITDSTS